MITVTTEADLAAVPATLLSSGERAYVEMYKSEFRLEASAQPIVPAVRVPANGKAGYLWLRLDGTPAWWSQLVFDVNPLTGDDQGTTLKTLAEVRRRTFGRYLPAPETNSFVINLLADAPDTDFLELALMTAIRSGGVNVTLQGQQTVVASGVVTATPRDPATNKGNEVTISGFDWTPHVGRLVRLAGTPTTTAPIEADLGSGTAQLGEQCLNGVVGPGFTTGQTIEVISLTKFPGLYVTGQGVTNVNVNDCKLDPALPVIVQAEGYTTNVVMRRCEIRGSASGQIKAPSHNLIGCSLVGRNFTHWGKANATATSWVNCPTVAFLGTGIADRAHIVSSGGYNSNFTVGEKGYLRLNNDFHLFGLAAGGSGITLQPGAIANFAGYYYGGGNDPTAYGLTLTLGGTVFYFQVTMNAGKGASVHGTDVAFAALPLTLTPQLNAIVNL